MSESKRDPQAPRIAIKFGGSSSSTSISTNGARKPGHPQPPSSLGKRSKPHALNDESESEEDEHNSRHEIVTTFGDETTKKKDRKPEAKVARTDSVRPFVIASQPNNWRAKERRYGKVALPHESEPQFNAQSRDMEPADLDKEIKWGLTITKKSAPASPRNSGDSRGSEPETRDTRNQANVSATEEREDADQDAMDALLGKDRKKKLVIANPATTTEADALKRDVERVGEESTLEDYYQIPDGEFGVAMLRGMGYNGERQAPKPRQAKRRPDLIGLGAKEDEEIKEADMVKKHGHHGRRPRLDEYRNEKAKERHHREERHSDSYKNERERERATQDHSRRHETDHRERHRDRGHDSHRHRDRNYRR